MQPHYYHESGGCSEESFVHFICKNWLFEKGCQFKVNGITYEVFDIQTEKTLHTSFGDYRPDIIVNTSEGKQFFFEIKYTNKKTELYAPKWDELGIDVVEVDAREFINNKHTNEIPEFKLIYSDGECFIQSYSRTDYEDTIAKRKLEWKRQDKLNYKIQWERLDWFWNKLDLYIHEKCESEEILDCYENVGYENIECCWNIVSKMNCVRELRDDFRKITNDMCKQYFANNIQEIFLQDSKLKIQLLNHLCEDRVGIKIDYIISDDSSDNTYHYDCIFKTLKWTILPSMISDFFERLSSEIVLNQEETIKKIEIKKRKEQEKIEKKKREVEIASMIKKSQKENKEKHIQKIQWMNLIDDKAIEKHNKFYLSIIKKYLFKKTSIKFDIYLTDNIHVYIKNKKMKLDYRLCNIPDKNINNVSGKCIRFTKFISKLNLTKSYNFKMLTEESYTTTKFIESSDIDISTQALNETLIFNHIFEDCKTELTREYKWLSDLGMIRIDENYTYHTYTPKWSQLGFLWLYENINNFHQRYIEYKTRYKNVIDELNSLVKQYKMFTLKCNETSYSYDLLLEFNYSACRMNILDMTLLTIDKFDFSVNIPHYYKFDLLDFNLDESKIYLCKLLKDRMKECELYGLRFFIEQEDSNDE